MDDQAGRVAARDLTDRVAAERDRRPEVQCAACGLVFYPEWSDNEAQAEMKDAFGNKVKVEDCEVVCDDCYKKMAPVFPS
jgi:hypothetical protein